MIYLHTELSDFFRNDPEITALVPRERILNEPQERYEKDDLPAIVFQVHPNGFFNADNSDRRDRLEVALIFTYGYQDAQKISQVIRKKMRSLDITAITKYKNEANTWLNGREKCVVIKASEEKTENYASDPKENLAGYIHTFDVWWRER